jgi:hypothetical protein
MNANAISTRKTNQHVILESRLRFLMSLNSGWKTTYVIMQKKYVILF